MIMNLDFESLESSLELVLISLDDLLYYLACHLGLRAPGNSADVIAITEILPKNSIK